MKKEKLEEVCGGRRNNGLNGQTHRLESQEDEGMQVVCWFYRVQIVNGFEMSINWLFRSHRKSYEQFSS